ncbi:MAG: Dabb family protein [Ruminococcaceae bacterium]|nr:Dabb family protein [Oscillospiraceae bacterium]
MVKHVILWKLKEDIEDSAKVKSEAKENLEALVGKVPGLLELNLIIEGLETSNCDMMLDSTLESFEALKAYAVHPDHVAAADGYVRPFTATRLCMDYEVE